LRELVIGGEFEPGQRLSEQAAVKLLGISRTPVRAALATLAHEGLLAPRSHGGFIVRDFSLADMLDAIELRGVLEGTAARMAAERSNGERETRALYFILTKIDALLESTAGDGGGLFEGYVALNEEFHDEMLRLAQSPMLERSLSQVTALPFVSPNAFTKASLELDKNRNVLVVAQAQHRAITDAISAGHSARAFMLGQEHAQTAADNLKALAGKNKLSKLLAEANVLPAAVGR
jgi:GntR family transcriptional regulator of vanillate catabolism